MKRLRAFFILALFLASISTSFISAVCEEGQIDINSASTEELDKIVYIGPARAQEMIMLRPFTSVDDMIRITGIGENNIKSIKSQGLACVAEEENNEEDEEKNSSESNLEADVNTNNTESNEDSSVNSNIELESINLNPQAIKSSENSEVLGKRNYAVYGLLAFGVLVGLLFLIKNFTKKNRHKNEFE